MITLLSVALGLLAAPVPPSPAGSQPTPIRPTANLIVESEPPGLKLTFEGKAAGKSPLKLTGLKPGRYLVAIDDARFQASAENLELSESEDRAVVLLGRPTGVAAPAKSAPPPGGPDAGTSTTVMVRVGGGNRSELLTRAVLAASKLGVKIGGASCAEAQNPSETAELVVVPAESSRQSPLGFMCRITVRLYAGHCAVIDDREESWTAASAAPFDRARACTGAWQKLTEEQLSPKIANVLRGL